LQYEVLLFLTHNTASRVNEGGHILLVSKRRDAGFGFCCEAQRNTAGASVWLARGRKWEFSKLKPLLAI
jgi:hypothetical protein